MRPDKPSSKLQTRRVPRRLSLEYWAFAPDLKGLHASHPQFMSLLFIFIMCGYSHGAHLSLLVDIANLYMSCGIFTSLSLSIFLSLYMTMCKNPHARSNHCTHVICTKVLTRTQVCPSSYLSFSHKGNSNISEYGSLARGPTSSFLSHPLNNIPMLLISSSTQPYSYHVTFIVVRISHFPDLVFFVLNAG